MKSSLKMLIYHRLSENSKFDSNPSSLRHAIWAHRVDAACIIRDVWRKKLLLCVFFCFFFFCCCSSEDAGFLPQLPHLTFIFIFCLLFLRLHCRQSPLSPALHSQSPLGAPVCLMSDVLRCTERDTNQRVLQSRDVDNNGLDLYLPIFFFVGLLWCCRHAYNS